MDISTRKPESTIIVAELIADNVATCSIIDALFVVHLALATYSFTALDDCCASFEVTTCS